MAQAATARRVFHSRFHQPFFSGVGSSSLVPNTYPIALDGHPYQVVYDPDAIGVWGVKFKDNALPFLRAQADQSNVPGEQSISPEQLWRRSQENWLSGSGQLMLDRKGNSNSAFNSIENRFYTSKGINPWAAYRISLLNDTSKKYTSASTGLQMVVCGISVYLLDNATLYVSSDGALAVWTAVTGLAGTIASITTDGTTVYVGTSTTLYTVTGTVATAYLATPSAVTLVAFVKGRIMIANGTSIYNPTGAFGAGILNTVLVTKFAGFTWVGFTGAQTQIYAAGYSGDQSLIYRIGILTDATALSSPIVAGELPRGEIVRSIYSYQGFVVIGSDLGVRFCNVNSDGSLVIGGLIPAPQPVYCFESQDRFIWYGLSNYDASSTGLGRMDLSTFTAPLVPAYASDLMATGQGAVRAVGTYNKARIFVVDGVGLYSESLNTPVASGTLSPGNINYGISDPKVAVELALKHEPLNGTISVSLQTDNGLLTPIGTSSVQGSASPNTNFLANQSRGFQYSLMITLTPTNNISPILTRWTLMSYPAPNRSDQHMVPISIKPDFMIGAEKLSMDVAAELLHLEFLLKTQNVVTFQRGNQSIQVIMFDKQFVVLGLTANGDPWGVFVAILNEITL